MTTLRNMPCNYNIVEDIVHLITNAMVFSVFDRSALHQIIHDGKHMYYRHEYEPATIMQGLTNAASYWDNYSNIFSNDGSNTIPDATAVGTGEIATGTVNTSFQNDTTDAIITAVPNNTIDTVKSVAEYLDQIMPLTYQAALKYCYMRETLCQRDNPQGRCSYY